MSLIKERPVQLERTDVHFPMWRKKVDAALLRHGVTPVPSWVARMWDVPLRFADVRGRRDPAAAVELLFEREGFRGQVVPHRAGRAYRLFLDDPLPERLRETFLMSHMRDLEDRLRRQASGVAGRHRKLPGDRGAEEDLPFWEFLDLEFDASQRRFHLTAHYVQEPTFPSLFARLTSSPPMRRIEDELRDKDAVRIQKHGWRPRSEYVFEIGARNVIYMLTDVERGLFYVGEADDMIARFNRGHPGLPQWTHYRYDLLPTALAPLRRQLERMLICDIDSVLGAWAKDLPVPPGRFRFANLKIDR